MAEDAYATYVSAPRDAKGKPGGKGGSGSAGDSGDDATEIAGGFSPVDPAYVFDTAALSLAWFDHVESADGPAAITRLVLDVSGVTGADTSTGFGSVYFSTTGPASANDIRIADLYAATTSRDAGDEAVDLAGSFYVKGTAVE